MQEMTATPTQNEQPISAINNQAITGQEEQKDLEVKRDQSWVENAGPAAEIDNGNGVEVANNRPRQSTKVHEQELKQEHEMEFEQKEEMQSPTKLGPLANQLGSILKSNLQSKLGKGAPQQSMINNKKDLKEDSVQMSESSNNE
jgi:hypothetical protein